MNSSSVDRAGIPEVAAITCLFWIVLLFGICGNLMVLVIVLRDPVMRKAVTNYFLLSLAMADLTIMLWGVPEIVSFTLNRGWLLGEAACRANRYLLTTALYASVITLCDVCIER